MSHVFRAALPNDVIFCWNQACGLRRITRNISFIQLNTERHNLNLLHFYAQTTSPRTKVERDVATDHDVGGLTRGCRKWEKRQLRKLLWAALTNLQIAYLNHYLPSSLYLTRKTTGEFLNGFRWNLSLLDDNNFYFRWAVWTTTLREDIRVHAFLRAARSTLAKYSKNVLAETNETHTLCFSVRLPQVLSVFACCIISNMYGIYHWNIFRKVTESS